MKRVSISPVFRRASGGSGGIPKKDGFPSLHPDHVLSRRGPSRSLPTSLLLTRKVPTRLGGCDEQNGHSPQPLGVGRPEGGEMTHLIAHYSIPRDRSGRRDPRGAPGAQTG